MKADFKVYPKTKHGFAIRGNENREEVRKAKQAALDDAIRVFKEYL